MLFSNINVIRSKLLVLIICSIVTQPMTVAKCMKSLGYGVVETVASPDGNVGRVDSCGLYFREDNWKCLDHETIRLDDLAILRSSSSSENGDEGRVTDKRTIKQSTASTGGFTNRKSGGSTTNINRGSLKGLERSFVRKNVALLVRLEHIRTGQRLVIVVAHLFWNPAYDYVKVRTHYRDRIFCRISNLRNQMISNFLLRIYV